MKSFGRFFVGVLGVFLLGSVALADPVLYLAPPPNGYTQVFAMGLSVKYSNIGGGIGQLVVSNASTVGVLEGGDPAAGGGVGISPLSFSLTADFNLSDGSLRTADAANNLAVSGSITSVPSDLTAFLSIGANNFYQSGVAARYGDNASAGQIPIFNFTFMNNAGKIWPGQSVYVILNPGTLTPASGLSPSSALVDGYTSGISGNASVGSPQLLWSNNGTSGTADVFTPLPRSIYMGFALLCGLGAMRYRRVLQHC
jgi:hypothetical protein